MAVLRIHLPHRRPRRVVALPPCHISPCPDCRAAGRRWATVRADWHAAQARARARARRALLRLAVLLAVLATAVTIGVIA